MIRSVVSGLAGEGGSRGKHIDALAHQLAQRRLLQAAYKALPGPSGNAQHNAATVSRVTNQDDAEDVPGLDATAAAVAAVARLAPARV